jgi:disulfide bond formation protein DsbB
MAKAIKFMNPARAGVAFAIAAIAAATLAGAWFFQLALGLAPCPLCLDQRWPYYIAVPLGLLVGVIARDPSREQATRAGFIALAVVLFIGAGLGVYHAGIEWRFWPGLATCAGVAPAPSGDILDALKNPPRFVSCDEAAWRLLGISLAGYNALIAGVLAWIAARMAYGSSSVSQ